MIISFKVLNNKLEEKIEKDAIYNDLKIYQLTLDVLL
jgi:hypothetical protein